MSAETSCTNRYCIGFVPVGKSDKREEHAQRSTQASDPRDSASQHSLRQTDARAYTAASGRGGACARPCPAACADRFGGSSDGAARAICFGLVPAAGCDRRRRSAIYCAPEALGRPIAHAASLAGRSWTLAGRPRRHTRSMDIQNASMLQETRRPPRGGRC